MEAAKKISNDLMPFAFKKSGNDLMSFCSKEWVDRLGWIDSAQITEKSVSWEMQLGILLLSGENDCTVWNWKAYICPIQSLQELMMMKSWQDTIMFAFDNMKDFPCHHQAKASQKLTSFKTDQWTEKQLWYQQASKREALSDLSCLQYK